MLRAILNKSWRQLSSKQRQPPISKTIQIRRIRHAGHCWRSKDELIRDIFLWSPSHGCASVGRSTRNYLQQLCADSGCSLEDMPEAVIDRDKWRESQGNSCQQHDLIIVIYIYIYIYNFYHYTIYIYIYIYIV